MTIADQLNLCCALSSVLMALFVVLLVAHCLAASAADARRAAGRRQAQRVQTRLYLIRLAPGGLYGY